MDRCGQSLYVMDYFIVFDPWYWYSQWVATVIAHEVWHVLDPTPMDPSDFYQGVHSPEDQHLDGWSPLHWFGWPDPVGFSDEAKREILEGAGLSD